MTVYQLSVYLSNEPGTLRALTKALADADIDMLALSLADTESFGLARIVVRSQHLERAAAALKEAGFPAKKNHVFCVSVPNRPAGLDSVLATIADLHFSIEYMYSFNYSIDGNALMILRLSSDFDRQEMDRQLSLTNIRLIGQDVIDGL